MYSKCTYTAALKITADLVSNKTYVQHFPISQISRHLDLRLNYIETIENNKMQAWKGFPKHGAKSDSFKAPTFIARIVFPEF